MTDSSANSREATSPLEEAEKLLFETFTETLRHLLEDLRAGAALPNEITIALVAPRSFTNDLLAPVISCSVTSRFDDGEFVLLLEKQWQREGLVNRSGSVANHPHNPVRLSLTEEEQNRPFVGSLWLWDGSPTPVAPSPEDFHPFPARWYARPPGQDLLKLPYRIWRQPATAALHERLGEYRRSADWGRGTLAPLIAESTRAQMADSMLHELSRLVSQPRSILNAIHSPLNRLTNSIRSLETSDSVENSLQSDSGAVRDGLRDLSDAQDAVESKVKWFFYLTSAQLREKSIESVPLAQVIRDALIGSGLSFSSEWIRDPEHPAWTSLIRMPKGFALHTFEALLSNSLIHGYGEATIRIGVESLEDESIRLHWENRASPQSVRELNAQLAKPVAERTFGLRMIADISRRFFDDSLEISADNARVDHQLRIPKRFILSPETAEEQPPADSADICPEAKEHA